MELSGFLVFSILTVSQYHYVLSIPDLLHFAFIDLLYYLDAINNNLVVLFIF